MWSFWRVLTPVPLSVGNVKFFGGYLRQYPCRLEMWFYVKGIFTPVPRPLVQWHFDVIPQLRGWYCNGQGDSWVFYASSNVKFFGGYLRQYPCRLEMWFYVNGIFTPVPRPLVQWHFDVIPQLRGWYCNGQGDSWVFYASSNVKFWEGIFTPVPRS